VTALAVRADLGYGGARRHARDGRDRPNDRNRQLPRVFQ
jgi:hypothetical protein